MYVEELSDVVDSEDFILTVWHGKERDSFSNTVDHSLSPPTKADILRLQKELTSYAGKHKRALGQLNAHVIYEYFRSKGFSVALGTPEQDRNKIDLVAENETHVIFVQAKLGDISMKTIISSLAHMSKANSEGLSRCPRYHNI